MFRGLLPDAVRWAVAPREATIEHLLDAECAAIATASPRRAREFAAGRVAARAALAQLGAEPVAIPSDDRRRPQWPPGVVGSITHCRGLAAAAVGWARELAALGIDAEPARPLGDDIAELVSSPAERQLADPLAATIVFSAKEAFYKCWSACGGPLLEFDDVALEAAVEGVRDGTFVARPRGGRAWPGRWAVRDGFVLTTAWRLAPSR